MTESHVRTDLTPGAILMNVEWELYDAKVIGRPNRFVVIADLAGKEVKCHLHDPGRLKELIFPGNEIKIREKPSAKTDYSVVCAKDRGEWVIIDSRFHPVLARNFLPEEARAEVGVAGKRIDFKCENEYVEVKGCTLLEKGIAKFPDAPSIRATEHVKLLSKLKEDGFDSSILILVIRKGAICFLPNRNTDPAFSDALMRAMETGVRVFFMQMHFDGSAIVYDGRIPLCSPEMLNSA